MNAIRHLCISHACQTDFGFLIEVAVPNFFFHLGNEFLTVISGVTDPAG